VSSDCAPITASVLPSVSSAISFLPEGVVPYSPSMHQAAPATTQTRPASPASKLVGVIVPVAGPGRYKRPNNNTTSALIQSHDVEDSRLRHSVAFSRVCSWGKSQVERWLAEYGASQHSIQLAVMDGCIDGSSLLKILNPAKLQQYGIVNLKVAKNIEKAHKELCRSSDEEESNRRHTQASKVVVKVLPTEGNSFRNVSFETVWNGVTKPNGRVEATISSSGSYVIEVSSAQHLFYSSHLLHVTRPGRAVYCSSLKPKLGRVDVQIVDALRSGKPLDCARQYENW
jgi:hypothetical protein